MSCALAYGIKVANSGGSKAFGNFRRGDDGADRMSIAHRFGHGHDIWNDLVRLKGPVVGANAAKAHLNLIGNRDTSGIADNPIEISQGQSNLPLIPTITIQNSLVHLLEVILRRDNLSTTALQTFGNKGRDAARAAFDQSRYLVRIQLAQIGTLGKIAIPDLATIHVRAGCL